jgi:hypothetical protein
VQVNTHDDHDHFDGTPPCPELLSLQAKPAQTPSLMLPAPGAHDLMRGGCVCDPPRIPLHVALGAVDAALCGLGDQSLLPQRFRMHAGWGSFPTKLQSSPMFKAIFEQSQRCYFIFQLATTVQHAARDGFFVVPPPSADCPFSAINFTTQLGPSLAVVAPDSRSQRSRHQILPQATFDWMISSVRCFQPLFLSLLTPLLLLLLLLLCVLAATAQSWHFLPHAQCQ